ncbi:GlxA family transcriptional regulator [Halomonas huangheensis]|uniref:HTH araC/xylS-type domain-containing protein n=1 Tax=Halomonas huangheensis TaxID=1178482 RepID=W1ND40_9GAMM|nr:helix-turn-helix domain-containing protein [Halomonas huangheensis]ALM52541.1 AraC family transcriptional regulator [Halomonas huangheensis]ERL52955.1 hypothetical protein BJB45_16880 [Halomonas huangheensis]
MPVLPIRDDTTCRIGVLMLPGQVPLDLVGPWQVLHCAARISGRYQIDYFGPHNSLDWMGPLQLQGIAPLPEDASDLELLVVPGQYRNAIEIGVQQLALHWLRTIGHQARTIMSVCSGTLLLAEAGLLDNRRCTSHHELLERLRQIAPAARVQEDCIFTDDGRFLTSAGISTGIDTMLHWLTRHAGHELALAVARDMVLYLRRSGQEPQLGIWLRGRNHVDARIHRLQDQLAMAPQQGWSVPQMARQAAMSERHLRRRFLALTGMSLGDYLAALRLQLARQLMLETSLGLGDIAARVGLGDDRQLRRLWSRHEVGSPGQWRRQQGYLS